VAALSAAHRQPRQSDFSGGAPTSSGRHVGQGGVSGSSPTWWGGVKAELQSDPVVLGGGGEIRWTTVASNKSWSTAEARRVRRSQGRRVGRAEAWSSRRGGNGNGGNFAIWWRQWAPTPGSGHTALGSRGEAAACFEGCWPAREKEGSGGGVGGSFLDRAETEQGEGVPAWEHHTAGEVGEVPGGVRARLRGDRWSTPRGDGGGGQRSGEQGRRAKGGSGTVARGPRLESVGQPGEKGYGSGPGKQF
jgi:hypothetical protein